MTTTRAAIIGLTYAGVLTADLATAQSNGPDWRGVWIEAEFDCLTEAQLESLANGPIPAGPHWHLTADMTCDALRGEPNDGSAQIAVRGLCRSFGALESKTWMFEPTSAETALVTGLSSETIKMKACRR